jgi:hypothetical protein
MSHLNTIFNQLLSLVPRHEFERSVSRNSADRYVKYFSCWQQFIVLLYAQIRKKESLRDITSSLLVLTEGRRSDIRIVKEEEFASKLLPDSMLLQKIERS